MKCYSCWSKPRLFIIHNHLWWVLDKTLWPGIETAVNCSETQRFASTKEISHSTIVWKNNADIVFDSKGIILQHCLPQKQTVNGVYYVNTLKTHFGKAIRKKRPDFLTKRWFLLPDNARPHIPHLAMKVLADIGVTPVQHPPYSPDLTPCDVWAFPTLKHELRRQKLRTDTEVKQATATTLSKMSRNGLLHAFEKWVGCCKKCLACEGRYFKKETVPKHQKSSDSE
jgi:hypothetical protein